MTYSRETSLRLVAEAMDTAEGMIGPAWVGPRLRALASQLQAAGELIDATSWPQPCSNCGVDVGDAWCADCATSADRDRLAQRVASLEAGLKQALSLADWFDNGWQGHAEVEQRIRLSELAALLPGEGK